MNNIGPQLHADRPRVLAFGGGKGGSGRSTLCSDISRAVSRYNQRILCVDTSWSAPTLNVMLGAAEPTFDFGDPSQVALGEEGSHVADFICPTNNASVFLLSLASARRYPFVRPSLKAEDLLSQLYELDFDWIFVDLPSGIDPLHTTLFTLSDIPIIVCTPEPGAVRQATQFLRAALYQAIGYHPEAYSFGDELLDMLYQQPMKLNSQSLRYAAPSAACRRIVEETTHNFETYLVVNLVREGAEHDLGFVLAHAWHGELGLYPRVLASIDYGDRRWFYNRRTTGVNPSRNDEAISNDVETLARHIREISLVDLKYPRPVSLSSDMHPALRIGINPETGRNEVRQHCRRLWEAYRRETTIGLVFSEPDRRMATAEGLEELYRKVLTMPSESFTRADLEAALRASEEVSRAPAPAHAPPERARTAPPEPVVTPKIEEPEIPAAIVVEQESDGPPQDVVEPEVSTTPTRPKRSPGDAVAALRREHKLSLQELSSRTHIGLKYLAAIEDVDLEVLPRRVYLRGYLREIARVFDVDPEPLIAQYFRYLEDS